MGFRVPASIGVKLVVNYEDGVATAADRRWLGLLDGLILVPCMCLQVEREYICEGSTGIVQTTVATVDVNLVVAVGGSHVGPRRGCADCRLLIRGNITVTFHALPEYFWIVCVWHFQEPAVIESHGGASVATEDEDFLIWGEDGGVLGSRLRNLIAFSLLPFPVTVPYF